MGVCLMERETYAGMAEYDSSHWWYVARRNILAAVVARETTLPVDARVLEIGCGTGHNLSMLGRFGEIDAIEIDTYARDIATKRLGRPIINAPLPELTGVAEQHYDLIALLDVLEHVEDDRAALISIARRLRDDGRMLITVPQYPFMWSGHDVASHHFRRYTKRSFRAVASEAGLKIDLLQSFNSLLFPLAVGDRMVSKLTGRIGADDKPPPAPLNKVFKSVFGFERYLVGRIPMPPGLSLMALLSVPKSAL
jgi:SAM-dependent methyltransferase